MIIVKQKKKIEDYQLRELDEKKLFINKYDLSFKYDYEMSIFWKEFCFDLIQEMVKSNKKVYFNQHEDLLAYLSYTYKKFIKRYNLKIDIKDYIDLNDYVPLDEWTKLTGNELVLTDDAAYLVQYQ